MGESTTLVPAAAGWGEGEMREVKRCLPVPLSP